MIVSIDNSGVLVTDTGVKRHINCEWNMAQGSFVLPSDTQVVTIKAHNRGGAGATLASFSNNVVTNESWSCAECLNKSDCDESNFKPAVTYGPNGHHPWTTNIPGIASSAQWIWVKKSKATHVWCRVTFRKLHYFLINCVNEAI